MQHFYKTKAYKLHNEELNEAITPFVIHVSLQHYELSCIIYNNNRPKFKIEQHCEKLMQNGP